MEYKSFHYPDGARACASGQRRCALTAMDLALPGAEGRKLELVRRAARTESGLKSGRDISKHDKLDYVVVDLFTRGMLREYIDTKTGDYTLNTFDGRSFLNNILKDLLSRKHFY